MVSLRWRCCIWGIICTAAGGVEGQTPSATLEHFHPMPSEGVMVNNQTIHRHPIKPMDLKPLVVDNTIHINANTSAGTSYTDPAKLKTAGKRDSTNSTGTIRSTILVIARDSVSAYSASSGLNDYGIPYELLLVPSTGTSLPVLNTSSTSGNYGGIVTLSEVSYPYANGQYASALTQAQWNTLFAYQTAFGVRMVRLDVVPSSATGTKTLSGCCASGVEQFLNVNDTSSFPTAGLVQGAKLSTMGLYHYPAAIVDSSVATAFAAFAPGANGQAQSTAAVINTFAGGRQQMVFFLPFSTDWSMTSNILQHAWIAWVTRGLYAGYRRAMLNTQVDDMFLTSPTFTNQSYRLAPSDLDLHISWQTSINARLPAGSNYTIEIGHNGNGNIGSASTVSVHSLLPYNPKCSPGPIVYTQAALSASELEYVKPLGTGANLWPATAAGYPYNLSCLTIDPLALWFMDTTRRDSFSHISHTFTHESLDNASYFDVVKEISWNQAWLAQIGLSSAQRFSGIGLIPPAITGLHNGDALRAWWDNGIRNVVGDNTRPALLNTINEHWPLITTNDSDNFAGIQITPRWATNIYYNCESAACDAAEWAVISQGTGNMVDLLAEEQATNVRHLLALHHDPFMFHQANLRTDVPTSTVGQATGQLSLLMMWVETVVQEYFRVVSWPLVSLNHDTLAAAFMNRMTRDNCNYALTYNLDFASQNITGITLGSANGNTCGTSIPVTFPGKLKDSKKYVTEKLGGDPLTAWVDLVGQTVNLELKQPLSWTI